MRGPQAPLTARDKSSHRRTAVDAIDHALVVTTAAGDIIDVVLVDEDGDVIPLTFNTDNELKVDTDLPEKTEGQLIELQVSDDNVQNLLNDILKQLRITNLHLSLITGEEITENDI